MNPTIKKLLDSINTLGRELEKGSGSSAESASNKNVEAELLQRFRNSPGGSASAVNAAHSTVPCETSSTSTSLNKLTNAPRFALGYNFSKRQKRKDTSKTATGSFIKDVILLGGPEDDKVPRQGLRVLLSENNHIVSGATLRKEWGFPTVIDYLKSLFPSKLGEFDEITILMPVHSKLLEPNLPPGQQLSGFMIQKVFKDRPVYIRPHKRILTLDEYLPKKKRKLESASSDEDSGDDLNNKSTFEVTTGVTSNQAQTDMTISGNMIQDVSNNQEQTDTKASGKNSQGVRTSQEQSDAKTSENNSQVVKDLIKRYGEGVVFSKKCPTCTYEDDRLFSAGVHESDSGSLRVYTEEDDFVCPKCSVKSNNAENADTMMPPPLVDKNKSEEEWKGPEDICKLVEQTVLYCNDHGITDPSEILRYYQKVMVTGRPLCITELNQPIEGDTNFILVDRLNLLQTAFDEIKSLKDLRLTLEVQFYGEEAEDHGGPRREFFRLVLNEIFDKYFDKGYKPHMVEDYLLVGIILGLSVLQDGKIPRFEEKVLNEIFSSSVENIESDCINQVVYGLKRVGIQQLGVQMQSFQELFKNAPSKRLTIKTINTLLKASFSEQGSNCRKLEAAVYRDFQKYLREVASGRRAGLNLGSILEFTTGTDEEPPLGFNMAPSLCFHEVQESFLPTANTCTNCLHLPRASANRQLPNTKTLFNMYDMAFANTYFGNK